MKRDFEKSKVEAARSVMFELMQLLKDYHNHIVLVGGSVPWVMIQDGEEPHVGTTDVDLAIDQETVHGPNLAKIGVLLVKNQYKQSQDKAFIFHRIVEKDGKSYKVQVDLLTGGDSTSKDELVQAVHGCELAFDEPRAIQTNGLFPDGHVGIVNFQVASLVPFISMKAIAFADRLEPKDAYDIYYCVKYYKSGLQLLAHEFQKFMVNPRVREGVDRLRENFSSTDAKGPRAVAEFLGEYRNEEKRAQVVRDAFERINGVIQQIPRT